MLTGFVKNTFKSPNQFSLEHCDKPERPERTWSVMKATVSSGVLRSLRHRVHKFGPGDLGIEVQSHCGDKPGLEADELGTLTRHDSHQ